MATCSLRSMVCGGVSFSSRTMSPDTWERWQETVPRPPDDMTFLFLQPLNELARSVMLHHKNSLLRCDILDFKAEDGSKVGGIEVGPHVNEKNERRITSIGSRGADIHVQDRRIPPLQCSFEYNKRDGTMAVLDRSPDRSTRVCGPTGLPLPTFEHSAAVPITRATDLKLDFGGPNGDLYRFALVWNADEVLMYTRSVYHDVDPAQPRSPRPLPPPSSLADDSSGNDDYSDPDSDHEYSSRPGSVSFVSVRSLRGDTPFRSRYKTGSRCGRGRAGVVVCDPDLEKEHYFTVEVVQRPALEPEKRLALKREVENLHTLLHPNIREYLGARESRYAGDFELVTRIGGKPVQKLIREDFYLDEPLRGRLLLHDMLNALDFLNDRGVVHRNIKPRNILLVREKTTGHCSYRLCNFALCHTLRNGGTPIGDPYFRAPELDRNPDTLPTAAADIFSLYAVLVHAYDVGGFRGKVRSDPSCRLDALEKALWDPDFIKLRRMAAFDPHRRASPADMLQHIFPDRESQDEPHVSANAQLEPDSDSDSDDDDLEDGLGPNSKPTGSHALKQHFEYGIF